MNETYSFGYMMRRCRKALDLTQAELAVRVGCAEVTIRRIEADVRRPSRQIAQRLADQLALPPDEQATFIQAARAELGVDQLTSPSQTVGHHAFLPTSAPAAATSSASPNLLPSGTVTFLFTDIEGSIQMWEQHPEMMPSVIARHDTLVRAAIEAQGGVIFKTTGDGVHAAFERAPDALTAAVAAQRGLHAEPWRLIDQVRVRMAIHTGSAEERASDYVGPPLNRVARLLAAGHGGQVLLSRATQELVADHLPSDVILQDLGAHRLKDLTRPEHIFQVLAPDLPTDFPPLRILDIHRHNLPAQATPLIGREREVAQVAALLRHPDLRLVTLTGPGGIGKTRLALQIAADLVEAFADGVWFIALAAISDPALVVPTIAQTLGIKEVDSQPLSDQLKRYLSAKQLLLVLDNFEQILDAAPLMAELLMRASQLTVLVTSRAVLHVSGEQEFAVPPLALPERRHLPALAQLTQYEAVRLFTERGQAVKPDFAVSNQNAPAVAEICYRLDGLPLAIELAAARIKLFPPEALLARLEYRFQVLTGGPRDLPARQQSLRNTIDWSYNLLDPGEQALFRRLGVFVGGCTLEAAAAVCNAAGDLPLDLVDGVASLTDKSLLQHIEGPDGEPRFTMLEMISEYTLERLEESGEAESIRRQHANYFVALAQAAEPHRYTPTQGLWLLRLDADHDNMRAALAWSQTPAASLDIGARLAGALQWFWYIRGYQSEGRAWLERALQQSSSAAAPARAKILYGAGRLQSDGGRATTLFEQALALWRELGDKRGMADALLNLGRVAYEQGDYERSGRLVKESLVLFQDQQITWGIVWALLSLGDVAMEQGDCIQALESAQQVLTLTTNLGDTYGNMWARCLLGRLAYFQGDLERAELLFEESLAWFRNFGNVGVIDVLIYLARVVLDQGDTARAATLFRENLEVSRELENKGSITQSLAGLAGVAGGAWQPARAAQLLGAAESIRKSTGASLTPVDRTVFDRYAATIRAQLDDATFAAMRAEGQKMTLEQAIAYALNESDESERLASG